MTILVVQIQVKREHIEAFRQAGIRDRIKVLIGGAPVTEQYAREIGADGYGANANVAVALARQIVAAS